MLATSTDKTPVFGDDDDEEEDPPFVQRVVDASTTIAPASAARSPRSVFELPQRPLRASGLVGHGGTGEFPPSDPRLVAKLQIADGITRAIGSAYPSRWTIEDTERERRRRARQRPPKPTKRAKTRGRKLLDMIGDDDGYE